MSFFLPVVSNRGQSIINLKKKIATQFRVNKGEEKKPNVDHFVAFLKNRREEKKELLSGNT